MNRCRSALRTQFLEPNSTEWKVILSSLRHDVYHLPEYVEWSARREAGKPTAFVAERKGQRLFVPLIIRPIEQEQAAVDHQAFDATCSRGFPGPLISCFNVADQHDFVSQALTAFVEGLRQQGVVSCFLRLHPLFPLSIE